MPDPSGAAGCVPETYTLVLSGGAPSIEPWNKMHDPAHAKENVLFTAIVLDSKGMPKPNIPVAINADVTYHSGGHIHSDARPKGKLAETVSDMATGTSSLTATTDSRGLATFYFGAEEASGEHTITATCNGCTNNPQTAKVNVEIAGLRRLNINNPCTTHPMLTILCLKGDKPWHPDNHYYTEDAMNQVMMLAAKFYTEFQSDILPQFREPLKINDSSLEKGGVFDIKQNWTPKHKGHRKGIVVDINNFSSRNINFELFSQKKLGVFAKWEGPTPRHPNTPPHYHLRLLGENFDG